jgi:hypothetical protein
VDGAEKPVSLHIERAFWASQVRGKGMLARKICLIGFLLIALAFSFQGCRDEDLARPDINSPPETILSVAPEFGDQAFHKFRVRWTGLDEDGVVTRYKVASVAEDELYGGRSSEEDIAEYLVDLPWVYTDATESLFVFRADRPNSRRHSLYVVAVDNEGKEDPSPALTNFTAIDYDLPVITIRISDTINPTPRIPGARGDTLPAYNLVSPGEPIDIRLAWEGYDPDGEIMEWRYKLDSAVEVPLPPESTGVTLTYLDSDPQKSDVWLGFHEFKLVAIDDANARSDKATARFVINYDPNTVIDSVWSYREKTNNSTTPPPGPRLPDLLIFAREWRDNPDSAAKYSGPRVGYQFGRLKMKFHGLDKDGPLSGAPPDSFRWSIQGINLGSEVGHDSICGEDGGVVFYCAQSAKSPRLDSDRPYTLIFSAIDDHGKLDGSPDTVKFDVNFIPEILGITYEVLDPSTGRTKISWTAQDIDEGYGWGASPYVQALMLYRFRYRLKGTAQYSQWTYVDTPRGRDKVVDKFGEIPSLEPGIYELELNAYNGTYVDTRVDKMYYEFSVP